MNKHITFPRAMILAVALVPLTGCGAAAKSKADAELKKFGVEVAKGSLPADFPKDLPTPALPLETAVSAAGTYTMRYTSKDAKADAAAYQKVMEKAGYMLTGEVDGLEGGSHNFTVTAKKGTSHITASAFNAAAPGGGNYLAVVVTNE
jgi:hypothetical protein